MPTKPTTKAGARTHKTTNHVRGRAPEGTFQAIHVSYQAFRLFDSVKQAVNYCRKQESPLFALQEIVCANIQTGEYGFASELAAEGEAIVGE
jgi:hypothetical protein